MYRNRKEYKRKWYANRTPEQKQRQRELAQESQERKRLEDPERFRRYQQKLQLPKIGWTLERYDRKMEEQEGFCAICREPRDKQKHKLNADHDHDTGKPRGLLCHRCNTSLERVERDPSWGQKALEYLDLYKVSPPNNLTQ